MTASDNGLIGDIAVGCPAVSTMFTILEHIPSLWMLNCIAFPINVNKFHYVAAINMISQPRRIWSCNGYHAFPRSSILRIVWYSIILPMCCIHSPIMPIMCICTHNIPVFIIFILVLVLLVWWQPSKMQRLNLGEGRLCPSFSIFHATSMLWQHVVATKILSHGLVGTLISALETDMHLTLYVFRLEPAEFYPTNPFQNMNLRIDKPLAS